MTSIFLIPSNFIEKDDPVSLTWTTLKSKIAKSLSLHDCIYGIQRWILESHTYYLYKLYLAFFSFFKENIILLFSVVQIYDNTNVALVLRNVSLYIICKFIYLAKYEILLKVNPFKAIWAIFFRILFCRKNLLIS